MKKSAENHFVRHSCCDIREEKDKIVMRLEMPGVTKDNLNINVDGSKLIIEGQRPEEKIQGKWLVREIRSGNYRMEYTIDETIDRSAIEATLSQGVLVLSLGISEAVKPRKIEVVSIS